MFRDKPYSHKVTFPDNFTMPDVVIGQVRKGSRIIEGVAPEVNIDGQSFVFTYSKESLQKIMGLYDQYFLFDGKEFLGGEINTVVKYGDPSGGESNVTISGDSVTVVQIPGAEIAQQTLEQVTQKATEVQNNATEVEITRQEISQNAEQVAQDRQAAEAARDEAQRGVIFTNNAEF